MISEAWQIATLQGLIYWPFFRLCKASHNRKNWLFSGHPNGANASATLFSLIETAKACGLEPYWYLRFLFEKLPFAQTIEDYEALLPQNVSPNLLILTSPASALV